MKCSVLFASLLMVSQWSLAGPRVVKNGGDIYAIEFLGIGQQLVKVLESSGIKLPFDLKKLKVAVDTSTVESTSQPLYLNGVEKDAINSPTKKTIVFNRITWAGRGDLSKKAILVLHEYLGVAGISDKKYEISSNLIAKTSFGKVSYDGRVFDRKLTDSEIRKLLPLYLSMISNQAKVIPSPADQEAFKQIRLPLSNPTYSYNGGEQVYRIHDLKDWIGSGVTDLMAITESERIQSTTRVIEDFKNAKGTITCEIGYSSVSRMKDQRIVKCEDNRSQPPTNDEDEGFGDIRTIILSIDDKTLTPIGVISIDVFIAG